jgi:hypothetical protein
MYASAQQNAGCSQPCILMGTHASSEASAIQHDHLKCHCVVGPRRIAGPFLNGSAALVLPALRVELRPLVATVRLRQGLVLCCLCS